MRRRPPFLCALAAWTLAAAAPLEAQQAQRTVVAVFAHPDDERIVGPLLARLAREGHDVHLVIATDGSKGVREHAGIAAGPALASARAQETRCATAALGIHPPILLGLEDAGLASFAALARLREELRGVFGELRPDAVITFGPEGGTGHPDHRLVGNVVTEVVQSGGEGVPDALYYPSLPAERMRDAPAARPQIATMRAKLLTVAEPFAAEDLAATHASFACHATQYTPAEMQAILRYLEHGWDGAVRLRPWNGGGSGGEGIFAPAAPDAEFTAADDITVEEVEGEADLAYLRGRGALEFTYRDPAGEVSELSSRPVHLSFARRGEDGQWRIARRAWSAIR